MRVEQGPRLTLATARRPGRIPTLQGWTRAIFTAARCYLWVVDSKHTAPRYQCWGKEFKEPREQRLLSFPCGLTQGLTVMLSQHGGNNTYQLCLHKLYIRGTPTPIKSCFGMKLLKGIAHLRMWRNNASLMRSALGYVVQS